MMQGIQPTALTQSCPHLSFEAEVAVNRLTAGEGGPVTSFTADVRIKCSHCHEPFHFLGVPAGLHPSEPRVSIDGVELRAPIAPGVQFHHQSRVVVPQRGQPPVASRPPRA